MSDAVRTTGLGKRFHHITALDAVDLAVSEGAVCALLGPPGAGKSTCLKLLLNVLAPSRGRAEVLGADSRRLTPRDFTRIGYLAAAQELPRLTAGYFLRFLSGFYPAWDAALESALVRQFQLSLDRPLASLSPATRAKAALIATLAYRPKLLLLDEPFRGLDALSRGELLQALLDHASGATMLIGAEDAAEVESFATHLACLDRGRLRFSEDLAGLRQRFRRMVLTFEAAPPLPSDWPSAWLTPERDPTSITFIDSQYDPQSSRAQARARFRGCLSLTADPMPVAHITAALSRAGPLR
jgi:ABC-2 type transport system ATP-binding protein